MFSELKSGGKAGFDVLRDARNQVWRCALPGKDEKIVIKLFRPPVPFRRFFQRKKGDKALRSWNGAQELLRRGIATPMPIAFFHHVEKPMTSASWYVCDEYAGGFSVRNAFATFSHGAEGFEGMKAGELYNQIALFLRKMHDRGVYFRDLSAGNLLFRFRSDKTVEFALIDTARAMFYDHGIGLRQRLCDLMRICHPLCWNGRKVFLAKYMALTGRRYRSWMNIAFYYYDFKHWMKKQLRRRRG
jgi:serine/threonine protein kinase